MDVFNQNWNQRIKTEPFTNQLLNNIKPETIRVITRHTTNNRIRRMTRHNYEFTKNIHEEVERDRQYKHPPYVKDWEQNREYIVGARYHKKGVGYINYNPSQFAYTRPDSLYNLRYTSLR